MSIDNMIDGGDGADVGDFRCRVGEFSTTLHLKYAPIKNPYDWS